MLFSRDLRRIPEALPYACHPEAGSFGRRISGLNGAIIKNEILRAVKRTLRMTPKSSHSERSGGTKADLRTARDDCNTPNNHKGGIIP